MLAVRIFLYVTIPLMLLAMLKGGSIISTSTFEVIIYVIPLGVYVAFIGVLVRKELHLISSSVLKIAEVLFFTIWVSILMMYLFWKDKVCTTDESCNLITISKLAWSLFICLAPLIAMQIIRKYKQNNLGASTK